MALLETTATISCFNAEFTTVTSEAITDLI